MAEEVEEQTSDDSLVLPMEKQDVTHSRAGDASLIERLRSLTRFSNIEQEYVIDEQFGLKSNDGKPNDGGHQLLRPATDDMD